MTTIVYNDVVLRDCEMLSFQQDVEYDSTDTDVMFNRFSVRVASSVVATRGAFAREFGINTKESNYNLAGTSVVRMHEIQAKLSQPRKDFWMLIDSCVQNERTGEDPIGQPLLVASGKAFEQVIDTARVNGRDVESIRNVELFMDPHPFDTEATTKRYGFGSSQISKQKVLDCDNGPKPKSCNITEIIGGRAFRVEFEIAISLPICASDYEDIKPIVLGGFLRESGNKVLSNRWSIEESKDENWITTRSLNGTLRVAHHSYWPHSMRLLCVPQLLEGYRRTRQSFVSDASDLVLKYRIDDRQAHAAPPYPAVSWSGHHAESASGPNGVTKGGEFHIKLTGPPGVDKQQLIVAASKVAINRINGLAPLPETDSTTKYSLILRNASIVDILHEPTIEFRVQVNYTDATFKALAIRIKAMGSTLDSLSDTEDGQEVPDHLKPYTIDNYNPRVWPVPLAYDSASPAGIFSCYMQDPCSIWHSVPLPIPPDSNSPISSNAPEEIRPSLGETYPSDGSSGDDSISVEYKVQHIPVEDNTDIALVNDIYQFPYDYFEIESQYVINGGWVSVPFATNNPFATKTSELIQLSSGRSDRVLTVTATRNGRPPKLPTLASELRDQNGIREVLSNVQIINKAPQLMADGKGRQFQTYAKYTYLMERPPRSNEVLRGGSTPMDRFSPDANNLNLAEVIDTRGELQWQAGVTVTYPIPG